MPCPHQRKQLFMIIWRYSLFKVKVHLSFCNTGLQNKMQVVAPSCYICRHIEFIYMLFLAMSLISMFCHLSMVAGLSWPFLHCSCCCPETNSQLHSINFVFIFVYFEQVSHNSSFDFGTDWVMHSVRGLNIQCDPQISVESLYHLYVIPMEAAEQYFIISQIYQILSSLLF